MLTYIVTVTILHFNKTLGVLSVLCKTADSDTVFFVKLLTVTLWSISAE